MKKGHKVLLFFIFRTSYFLLGFTSISGISFAQQYQNLVFEGGGVRGIAYVSVVDELSKRGVMDSIQRVGGTSAGAIIALTVSLGYRSDEILQLLETTSFQDFNDGRFFFVGGFHRMNKRYGWYRGKKFSEWLEKVIAAKTGNPNITFAELHQRQFKDLYVTGTCLNRQKLIIFSHETYPSMKIKDAVRISMSIPLYFEAILIDSIGKVYPKTKGHQGLDIVVDGGIIGNFPIFLFDTIDSTGKRIPNPNTLGIRIDNDQQILFDKEKKGLAPLQIDNFKQYLSAFYYFINENINRQGLTEADWQRTISVSSSTISQRVRRMSKKEITVLTDNGRKAVKTFFENKTQ